MSNNIAMADAFMSIFGMKRVDNQNTCQSCRNRRSSVGIPLIVCDLDREEKNAGDTCIEWSGNGAT